MHVVHLEALDLNLLRLLDALLSEGSVSKAAERVGLSQSAASHALSRLRDYLQDPLLVRSARGMALTQRAKEMREPLRRALTELARAVAPPVFSPATEQRVFQVIAADYAQCILVPRLLARLGQEAPGVSLVVLPFTDAIERELLEDRGELAMVVQYDDQPGLRVQAVLRERFVCAVHREHPHADEAATLDGYLRLRHVRVAPRGRQGSLVDSLLDQSGRSRQIGVSVPSFLVAPFLVANTELVATLPERLAQELAAWLPLRLFEPPLELPGFTLSMLWNERLEHDPSHRFLRELIRDIAKSA